MERGIGIILGGAPPRGSVCVFYGHDRVPRTDEKAHGGAIKFQRMQAMFPNAPRRFNVLYMASSWMSESAVPTAWFAKRKGARLVWNQDGVAYPAWHGPGWERVNAPMARLLHAADYVFYQSEFCRLSADRYLGERQGPSEVLYNAVDTSVFIPSVSAAAPRGLVLLLAGTQYQLYRLATAVRVLARVVGDRPDARLLVTGRLCWIPDEQEARRIADGLVAELGMTERVTFVGSYAQAEAPAVYRQAHLLLHTKNNDPCPGVVVEAMACGLPVVYSRSGGVPELVGDDAGIGIPVAASWEHEVPPDAEAMARAVLAVAEHRSRFAAAARQRSVERFDLRAWLRRHQEVFEELLG